MYITDTLSVLTGTIRVLATRASENCDNETMIMVGRNTQEPDELLIWAWDKQSRNTIAKANGTPAILGWAVKDDEENNWRIEVEDTAACFDDWENFEFTQDEVKNLVNDLVEKINEYDELENENNGSIYGVEIMLPQKEVNDIEGEIDIRLKQQAYPDTNVGDWKASGITSMGDEVTCYWRNIETTTPDFGDFQKAEENGYFEVYF